MPPRHTLPGHATRGTTGTNRLRRVDRWIARHPALRRSADPLVIDLGFGASAVTALELEARLAGVRDDVEVLGLEIDPERVASANRQLERVREGGTSFSPDARVSFGRGGFEVPVASGRRPAIIRTMNVLRQYDETEVAAAWESMAARLAPGGLLVEGTCDEIGRVCTWVALDADAVPRSLTLSLRLTTALTDPEWRPSVAAERLPKALIHRNVPGEPVHAFLAALDREWARQSVVAPFGAIHRWKRTLGELAATGWPLREPRRWRLGEVTVPWASVAPRL